MSIHQQTNDYLLGYADALELVGRIIQESTRNGLTMESTINMMNSIIETIYESKGFIETQPDPEELTVEKIITAMWKGGQ